MRNGDEEITFGDEKRVVISSPIIIYSSPFPISNPRSMIQI
jgi:hypothetical protein